MKIIHPNGRVEQTTHLEFREALEDADDKRRAVLENLIKTADLETDDGRPITGATRQRLVARCLGTYDHMPPKGYKRPRGQQRWLIPDLWPWGWKPMLGGNQKAGKTTVIGDLTAALMVPGYRFLGHFDPVPTKILYEGGPEQTISAAYHEETQTRGVWVVNGETPAAHFEETIERGMDRPIGDLDLTVDHLDELGGAQWMDLTDPPTYDWWVNRLAQCYACDGSDDWVPTTVIVDGLTAILHAADKGPEWYGRWYAAFKKLLIRCDIPNGLVTAHNTMQGGHLLGGAEAGAGPDGLWIYSSADPDRPDSPRRFTVLPRTGGVAVPPTRVILGADGRPVISQRPVGSHGLPGGLSDGRTPGQGQSAADDPLELSPASLSPGEAQSGDVVTFDLADDPEDVDDTGTDPDDDQADDQHDDQRGGAVLEVAQRVRAFVTANPGADGQQITDALDVRSKGLDWKGRTEAIKLGWVREQRCSSGCSVCRANGRRWHNNRRHFFAL